MSISTIGTLPEKKRMDANKFTFKYVPALDGIRGVAVLGVMVFHAGTPFFQGGFIGVDLFFVLSGFLITTLLVQEFNRTGTLNLKNFYMRRMLRLVPALILFLLTYLTLSLIFLDAEKAQSNLIDASIVLFYFANWALAFNIHPPILLGHAWSLSIEEQFYIIWPIILFILLRILHSRRWIVVIATSLTLLSAFLRIFLMEQGTSVLRLYFGLDTRADALLIGCTVGIILSSNILKAETLEKIIKHLRYLAPLSAILLFISGFFLIWHHPSMYYFAFLVIEILCGIIILDILISEQSFLRKILSTRILVWLGGISYGLYLWHHLIYRVMFLFSFPGTYVITIGTGLTILLASISYYFFERPFLKLKSQFSQNKIEQIRQPREPQAQYVEPESVL